MFFEVVILNNVKDPILRLINQVITVSLETIKIVKSLPELGIAKTAATYSP
jgi:hypothetical protein